MATECGTESRVLRTAASQSVVVSSDSRGRLTVVQIDRDLADAALKAQKDRVRGQVVVDPPRS